jgi:NADH-quinone oxidoreductase subunit G
MPKIIIDEKEIECRDGIPVLLAALEAGWDVPHYCYHPGLTVVASCRLCLMEMKMPHPQTKEMGWAPKLLPSCQTPVRDGMEVRFASETVDENRRHCMEYYLLNHPLDCPVCDQAGECWLQDYSYKFGNATSRMVEAKTKNPKKDIGSKTLLYQDRCVLCSRCVRFADEVAGTSELCIVNRGNRAEIDVFPGVPLENPIQGNVVDLCPVGALLDKDFLMEQRVWMLRETPSICPGCSTGCAITIDQNEGRVWRLKPRYNPGVNDWWMCDEGRFGWKYIQDTTRITRPVLRRGAGQDLADWNEITEAIRYRFEETAKRNGGASIAAVVSPFMACEEAWMLVKFIRAIAPEATLVVGSAPVEGEDLTFPANREGAAGNGNGACVKFTIHKEKCPNRRGVELIVEKAGGTRATMDEFIASAKHGAFTAVWIAGGSPKPWVDKTLSGAMDKVAWYVLQDMFDSALTPRAGALLPACTWAEREGSFMNQAGKIQPFDAALPPPEGAQRDGQYLATLAGMSGLYRGDVIRAEMAKEISEFGSIHEAPPAPVHAH